MVLNFSVQYYYKYCTFSALICDSKQQSSSPHTIARDGV